MARAAGEGPGGSTGCAMLCGSIGWFWSAANREDGDADDRKVKQATSIWHCCSVRALGGLREMTTGEMAHASAMTPSTATSPEHIQKSSTSCL